MKKVFLLFGLLTAMFAFTSCEDNDELLPDENVPEDQYAGELILEDIQSKSITIYTSDIDSTAFEVLVTFKSSDKKMRRLYMTQNIAGAGSEPYELGIENLDLKGDGSLDVESKQGNEFSFVIPFPILSNLEAGTVEYQLWATNARGDYRDNQNSLAVGVGTIVVNYGGTNPETAVKNFSTKLFYAPLADGSSKTFISVLNGELFKISEGEEYASFWDFGYYYGATNKASLASTYSYPALFDHDNDANTNLVSVATLTGTEQESLNHCYFAQSSKTSTDFDVIKTTEDLDFINDNLSNEVITDLSEGDIIEFVDNYGKKGIIKVESIKGTWNSGDYIELDIKMQP